MESKTAAAIFVLLIGILVSGLGALLVGALIYLIYDVLINFPETFGWPFLSYWKCVGIGVGIMILKSLFTTNIEVKNEL